jgi:hypothetical protein
VDLCVLCPPYALMVWTGTASPRLSLPEMKNKLRAPVASAQEGRFNWEQNGRFLGPKRRYGCDDEKKARLTGIRGVFKKNQTF